MNPNFKEFDDGKIIVSKSSPSSNLLDTLFYCNRKSIKIKIPDFIQFIYPFAFAKSRIRTITIPSNVLQIGNNSFKLCTKLRTVKFQKYSKIKLIDREAFFASSITKAIIPKEVTKIGESAFSNCSDLKTVIFEDDSKLRTIESHAFYYSAIKNVCITSKNLVNIGDKAFCNSNLLIVEMASIQNLNSIKKAFPSYSRFILMVNNEAQINKQ